MKSLLKLGCLTLLSSPVVLAQAQTTVTRISAGFSYSLFTKSDGSLWGMGYNSFGAFDTGSILNPRRRGGDNILEAKHKRIPS
jgi:alpha-tubulin suppressor-like RCC1 family protein